MQCPDCGYMLSAFDKECPRCKNYKSRGKTPPTALAVQTPPQPVPVTPPPIQPNTPPAEQTPPNVMTGSQEGSILDPGSLDCALCGNHSTQKATSICRSDTWTTHSKGYFSGYGMDSAGHVIGMGGPTASSSVGMTGLAQRLLPPSRPYLQQDHSSFIIPILGFLIAIGVSFASAILGIVISVGTGFCWFFAHQTEAAWNEMKMQQYALFSEQWEYAMVVWGRVFYCQRCDHVFDAKTRSTAPIGNLGSLLYIGAPEKPLPVAPKVEYQSSDAFSMMVKIIPATLAVMAVIGITAFVIRDAQQEHDQQVQKTLSPLSKTYGEELPRVNTLLNRAAQVANGAQTLSGNDDVEAQRETTTESIATDSSTLQADRDTVQSDLDALRNAGDDDLQAQATSASSDLSNMQNAAWALKKDFQTLDGMNPAQTGSTPTPAFSITTKAGGGPKPNLQPLINP